MSEKQKLGLESAFPTDVRDSGVLFNTEDRGMSKRFYAACAAMQGLYTMETNEKTYKGFETGARNNGCNSVAEYIAKQSYIAAEELLKQENQ